jgi:phenylalanyl-tRNA synthetase beta chain
MNISYNWLKEFIDLQHSPDETAEKLTLIGLEVEEFIDYGNTLDGVVVGEVLEVFDHPNADRLRICRVNIGDDEVQIICGADNVAKGQKVPVATVGTTLPVKTEEGQKLTIKKAKLRGKISAGMICAEDELGLGSEHEGIMVLNSSTKAGTPVSKVFDLQKDTIFNIAITPNRPDATCHLGVARDLAAALDLDLNKPFETDFEEAKSLEDFDIEIKNQKKCPRYVGKIIKDITVGESPTWIKNRLKALGIRPVNNVVDATNYVMHELGQPLHAFDKAKLQGHKIVVQDFKEAIEFETLDHIKRNCPAGTLFICDDHEPVAIAGIMGGVDSEVTGDTTDVLLESAYFDPASTRKTAKDHLLQTDASYRFERGIDPTIQRIAAERAAELIAQTAGGMVLENCSDVHPVKHKPREVILRKDFTNRLLGTDFSLDEIKSLLDGLELSLQNKKTDELHYQIPPFRPDLQREVDLIEEVGRLYDYNNIPAPENHGFSSPESITEWEQLNSKIKTTVKGLRFREIYTNSLIGEKEAARLGETDDMLHTLNPNSTDTTTLRPSLLHGFLESAAYNFNRNEKAVRFFETGHVFKKDSKGTYYSGIGEDVRILLGLAGFKTIEHWSTQPQNYTLFDLKAVVNSFLKSLDLSKHLSIESDRNQKLIYAINETQIGVLQKVSSSMLDAYEINLPVFTADFSISTIYKLKKSLEKSTYRPVPKFPAFEFDFGVIVDKSVTAQQLLDKITETAGPRLDDIQVFDVFEDESLGENKKNIAFRLLMRDQNKTLTINDVEPIIEKVLDVLDDYYSAKLRGELQY